MGYRYIDHWVNHSYGWYLNQNGAGDGLSIDDVEYQALLSHNTWTSSSVSSTDLTINYLGRTTVTWGNDGINTVYWAEEGDPAFEDGGPLHNINPGGITCVRVNSNYEFIEADVIMNGKKNWIIAGSDYDPRDIRGCLTHEVGHTIGLGHPSFATTPAQTMWVYVTYPDDPRDLTDDDIVGVSFLYSGKITDDRTLGGSLYFNWPISIVTGKTLTLNAGSTLRFESGASLIVNGTLSAVGTSSNKIKFYRSGTTGYWGSIIFDGAGSSNSVLDYVEIENASAIQCLNNASITIQNSLIQNCIQGIYIYNSEPKILNNQIIDPLQNGIHGITSAGEVEIFNNTIIKNTGNPYYKQYQGIWFENNSQAFVGHNDVNGFYWGMYYGGGSVGYFFDEFGETLNPNNRAIYCRRGIGVGWGSYCLAGYGTLGANNTIMNNDWNDFYVYQSSNVWAQYNYWGGYAGTNYVDGTSTLHDEYYLQEDPWEGYYRTFFAENDNTDLVAGFELERKGKINEAVSHYKQMVNRNVYPGIALTRLAVINKKYSINSIQIYFETFIDGENLHKDIVLNLLASLYLNIDRYNDAIDLYDKIIDQYNDSYASVSAKFEKFFAALNSAKNGTLASNILSEIQSLNLKGEEYLMRLEFADYLLKNFNSYYSHNLGKYSNSNQKNVEERSRKEFSLLENYPNPFNPATKISYQLPIDAYVTLKVYDLLGREITTLINEERQAGTYELEFDASSLSSGIYLYRITMNDFVKTLKMMVVK